MTPITDAMLSIDPESAAAAEVTVDSYAIEEPIFVALLGKLRRDYKRRPDFEHFLKTVMLACFRMGMLYERSQQERVKGRSAV